MDRDCGPRTIDRVTPHADGKIGNVGDVPFWYVVKLQAGRLAAKEIPNDPCT